MGAAIIKVIGLDGMVSMSRALIDSCSQASFISESLCQRLRLKRKKIHAPITGIGAKTVSVSQKLVSFTLQPHFKSDHSYNIDPLMTAPSTIVEYSAAPSNKSICEDCIIKLGLSKLQSFFVR